MQVLKGFGLVMLAVVAIVIGYVFLALCVAIAPKKVKTTIKALPQTRIAGYLMPVREQTVSVDYSKFTVRELKAMARGTGIKAWEKLRKAELVAALGAL